MLDAHSGIKNRNTRGKQKNKIDTNTAEGRAQLEMQKAEAFRHREQKRAKKGNRLRARMYPICKAVLLMIVQLALSRYKKKS